MSRLAGKVALVTGASRGIGAATAKRLAVEGAKVIVNYARSAEAAEDVVATIEKDGGEVTALQADMSDEAQIKHLFAKTLDHYGQLNILVNNAGNAEFVTLDGIDEGHIQRQFDLNVRGVLYACREAARAFGDSGGRIINISSIVSRTPPPGGSVYSATKAAVDAITQSLAAELAPKITVNAVAPGYVDTEVARAVNTPESTQHILSRTPMGRLGQPDDIASVIAFLASLDAAWVTGQILGADGGFRF